MSGDWKNTGRGGGIIGYCISNSLSLPHFLQDVKYIQTDGYRAPEAELQNSLAQAGVEMEGDSGCTAAVDLWSLGIILLEMFSGIKLKDTVRSQEWKVGVDDMALK